MLSKNKDLKKILTKKEQEYFSKLVEHGTKKYKATWRAIFFSRKAFEQVMPEDIEENAKNSNDHDADITSRTLYPGHTFIGKKMVEELTALPFRFETMGNTTSGQKVSREIQRKLKSIYSRVGMMRKVIHNMYNFVIGGTSIVEPVTYRQKYSHIKKLKSEDSKWDFKMIPMDGSRVIDIVSYDPMMSIIDWNANPADIERTSRFFITTTGFYSEKDIRDIFPEKTAERILGIGAVGDWNLINTESDEVKEQKRMLKQLVGIDVDSTSNGGSYAHMKYFTGDGFVHEFLGGHYLGSDVVNSRIAEQIPVVITPSFPHPENPFGVTLWDHLRYAIELASEAINTVADTTQDNASMPWLVDAECHIDGLRLEDLKDRDFIAVHGGSMLDQLDLNKAIRKLESDEVTEGTRFIFNMATQLMYQLVGANPLEFGIQDKQIRQKGVAEMTKQSMLRSDSDMARKYESGLVNPLTWSIVRIMYAYFDDFNFGKNFDRNALSNPEIIRVVPGSYLPEDRYLRIGRAVEVVRRSMQNPRTYELDEVEFDYLEAIGVPDPERLIRSGAEIIREQLAMAIAKMSPDGRVPDQAKKLLDQLAQMAAQDNEEGDTNNV